MTPPRRTGGNTRDEGTFDPFAMAELEGRVANGEKDLQELKDAVDAVRESSSEIKKTIADDRMAVMQKFHDLREFMAREFGKLEGFQSATKDGKGDLKWLVATVVSLAALGLAAWAALKH